MLRALDPIVAINSGSFGTDVPSLRSINKNNSSIANENKIGTNETIQVPEYPNTKLFRSYQANR